MEFSKIIKRAIEIRKQYAEVEKKKNGKEWNNEQIMQGFIGDVGDLAKLIMAKEGLREIKNINEKLEHELVDCLWVTLVLANNYNIDIEKSFFKMMNDLEKKLNNK